MDSQINKIELTPDELKSLRERIQLNQLTTEDLALFDQTLSFTIWLQHQLERFKITAHKLRLMIFGKKTETSNNLKNSDPNKENASPASAPITPPETEQQKALKTKAKGHGRIARTEYTPDETIEVKHDVLKPGDICPTECGGKLYEYQNNPGGIIRIKGQSCAHVVCYQFEKLRCGLCGEIFIAKAPDDFPEEKYDECFKANIVVQKYFMASPFYRQEQHQKLLGLRLPDATQWDLVESVANYSYPVFKLLEYMAANANNVSHDDTRVKILDVIKSNKLKNDKERKGMFTTCIYAQHEGRTICLYYSGIKHGGENVSELLKKRSDERPTVIQMCDALAANMPKKLVTILCNCLTHGRRKFVEIEAFFPDECQHVIKQLAFVYKHEEETKKENMSAIQRLEYHQKHSKPILDDLKSWLENQFSEKKVEPNCGLGDAIKYMLKHWEKLTRFLSVSGAPIDNNVVERSLKLAIRTRKNAMFHKSLHGAQVASILLSILATCEIAKVNPINYLVAVQKNRHFVFQSPHLWLPWNYEEALNERMLNP